MLKQHGIMTQIRIHSSSIPQDSKSIYHHFSATGLLNRAEKRGNDTKENENTDMKSEGNKTHKDKKAQRTITTLSTFQHRTSQ